ncbi:hypothetical protein [Seonamhaeicola marinus]|uniref:Uncharacterized protein n=1 Tax=Seonamhaeicola marinus TaxID=1912246 RepID=A0A5D0HU67_9FLAO|nr:hypothetical protein [Seonamhaeicola marinus]TYA74855.1 hypothetical protein FUA24_16245 [Seonamhaeicola marinus]
MAPVKFDSKVKEQLEKRTIQPSSAAWNKLAERLDAEEQKGKTISYWWLGIAASVIGILLVAFQYFNGTSEEIVPEVVDNPIKTENVEVQQELLEVTPEEKHVIVKTTKEKIKAPILMEENQEIDLNPTSIELAANTKVENTPVVEHLEPVDALKEREKIFTFEEEKIQEVVAKVNNLKEQNKKVTEAEIEALLKQAQQEIAFKKLYDESTGIVDANALLQDVEEELDQSFRNRVFEALKKSYGTVKTAVATRNE